MNEGQISASPAEVGRVSAFSLYNGEAAQAHEGWVLLIYGVIAASNDPAEYYLRQGEVPARAQVLGERIALAMRHSRWGIQEDELGHAMTIASTQGVPGTEFPTVTTLATLVIEATEALRGEVSAERLPVQCLTEDTGDGAEEGEQRPDLLELETKHVMLTTLAALIDGHADIKDWIPRDRDPCVRIREPRYHPGLPLIVTPFVVENEAAWEAVEAGAVVDRAFIETSPTVEALRLELTQGPTKAS